MAARFVQATLARIDGTDHHSVSGGAGNLVQQVHARGLVHLDTPGGGNLLMPDGAPGITASGVTVHRWMPAGATPQFVAWT
jgi:hypothetical protein